MRRVRDTGDSGTLSPTIAASQEISGFPSHSDHSAPRHDQLQISRYIANTRKQPQHVPAICFLGENENALLWQLHSYSLDRKRSIGHQSQFVEISTIYVLVLMNETFC